MTTNKTRETVQTKNKILRVCVCVCYGAPSTERGDVEIQENNAAFNDFQKQVSTLEPRFTNTHDMYNAEHRTLETLGF